MLHSEVVLHLRLLNIVLVLQLCSRKCRMTPLLPNNSVCIRYLYSGEREHYMCLWHLLPRNCVLSRAQGGGVLSIVSFKRGTTVLWNWSLLGGGPNSELVAHWGCTVYQRWNCEFWWLWKFNVWDSQTCQCPWCQYVQFPLNKSCLDTTHWQRFSELTMLFLCLSNLSQWKLGGMCEKSLKVSCGFQGGVLLQCRWFFEDRFYNICIIYWRPTTVFDSSLNMFSEDPWSAVMVSEWGQIWYDQPFHTAICVCSKIHKCCIDVDIDPGSKI